MNRNVWRYNNTLESKVWEESMDRLCEDLFHESAAYWSDLRPKYSVSVDLVIEHLLKIFYYRDFDIYIKGWIVICSKYYSNVPVLKNTHRPPSKEQTYACLWEDYEDTFEQYHLSTVEEFNESMEDLPKIEVLSPNAYSFCQDYMMWVSYMISIGKKIASIDAACAIEDLLEKYPI